MQRIYMHVQSCLSISACDAPCFLLCLLGLDLIATAGLGELDLLRLPTPGHAQRARVELAERSDFDNKSSPCGIPSALAVLHTLPSKRFNRNAAAAY